jgi:hypothetical protein
MKQPKMKKLEFIVHLFEDRSVGIFGGRVPVNVEIPEENWNLQDEEQKAESLKLLKESICAVVDQDGYCQTLEEYESEFKAEDEYCESLEE